MQTHLAGLLLAAVTCAGVLTGPAHAQPVPPPAATPSFASPVETAATGFQFTEGPLWHPDGFLLFSDIPANRIYRLAADGTATVWRADSGSANGLTLDRQGRLIACEHGNRRVSITAADGTVAALAERWEGARLTAPTMRARRRQ